jgi:hypothetical protein
MDIVDKVRLMREEFNKAHDSLSDYDHFRFHWGNNPHTQLLDKYQPLMDRLRGLLDVYHLDSETHRFQGVFINTKKQRCTSISEKSIQALVDEGLVIRFKHDAYKRDKYFHVHVYTIWFTHLLA